MFLEHNNNDDDCSDPVVVDGIIFGNTRQTVLYVRLKKNYSGTPLLWTPWGPGEVSCIERCTHFRN